MKLISWNINGIRAVCEKTEWKTWFSQTGADVIGFQETKAEPEQIPEEYRNPKGWRTSWLASVTKKGYSGTALFLRDSIADSVDIDFELDGFAGEGRLIHAEFPQFHYFNVYFPNGGASEERLQYKLAYYDEFLRLAECLRRKKPIVVCGDFNTAHHPIDLSHPEANRQVSGFLPIECEWMDKLVGKGYTDTFRYIHGNMPHAYSWWSYKTKARERNIGWRLDYFFISDELLPKLTDAWIDTTVTGSDHCPVGIELNL